MIASISIISPSSAFRLARGAIISSSTRSMSMSAGKCYFVGTPIGNLGDMSARAVEILRSVDVIAAEDTRHTLNLLRHFEVDLSDKKLVAHHEHNHRESVPGLISLLRRGESLAVVSDAGTPGISDPGTELAAACAKEGISAHPIPGPSALIAALSVSGFNSSPFTFFGFIPAKGKARKTRMADIESTSHVAALYEAPHRMLDTLRDLAALDEGRGADRACVCARELTKLHEEIRHSTGT